MAKKKECVDCGKIISPQSLRCCSCNNKQRWAVPGRKERQREIMSDILRENSKQLWEDPKYIEKQPEWRQKANEVRWSKEGAKEIHCQLRSKMMREYWSNEENRKAANQRLKEHYADEDARERARQRSLAYFKSIGHIYADSKYPPEFNGHLKECVRVRDNRRCMLCCKTEKENGRKLAVHHIDGDKTNNAMCNLVSLCGKCHGSIHQKQPAFWHSVLSFCRGEYQALSCCGVATV